MTSDKIIDAMIKAIGEKSTTSPIRISRADMLIHANHLYQEKIGPLLNKITSYTYDASDATHTITSGVGTLPSDFLAPHRVYDGDAGDDAPLAQIFDIADRVGDGDITTQFMIPNETTLWIFGLTPTNTIKLYYLQKPVALTDAGSSSPVDLKARFHFDVFTTYAKMVDAKNRSKRSYASHLIELEMLLDQIREAHKDGRRDNEPGIVKAVW